MKSGGEQGRNGRRVLWLATAAAAGLLAVSATAASAAAQDKRITIPAEDASASIPALARQSGLQVFAPTDAVRGVRTNPVNGSYTPMEALNRLLAGTGLHAVQTGDNAVTIRRAIAPDGQAQQTNTAQSGPPPASESPTSTVGEVVVTGTRIKRPGFDTLEAALTTSAKDIEDRGYTNIADALQDTPGFGIPGSSPLAAGQGRGTIAQSYANFLSLGSQRTLTLVDGQRYVSSNTVQIAGSNASPGDQVDLNLIPVGLIDHVETIAIGGAPVYGSDAIAGTVNVILKQHFSGVQMSAQYGITEKGDAENGRVSILAGRNFADDRGNVVFSAEFDDQRGLLFSARSGLPFTFANPTGPSAEEFFPDIHFSFATEGGLPYDGNLVNYPGVTFPPFTNSHGNYIQDASGTPLQFDSKGNLVPFNVGKVVNAALGGGLPIESVGGDGVNAADHFSLLSPTKRALFNFNGHYDVSNDVRFFWESSFAHTEATVLSDLTSIDSPNLISSGAYTLTFSVDNPYLTPAARAIITAPYNDIPGGIISVNPIPLTTFQLSRNMNDIVDRDPATSTENVWRFVAGFDGKYHPWGQDWTWNLSANYGESHDDSHDNYINVDHLLLAIDAVSGPGGSIVCASGGSCVPIDLFGENAFTPAAAKYVSSPIDARSVNTQLVLTANTSGALPFSIGHAEPIAVNFGAEYRQEGANFTASPGMPICQTAPTTTGCWQAGDVLDGVPGAGNAGGSFNTKEIYAEAVVPLISPSQANPLIKSAQFEGAVRYVDHSITGGATTWSAGGRIAPRLPDWGDGLMFRGVFAHSIRSPAIAEFALPQTGQLDGLADPCDFRFIDDAPKGTEQIRVKNCTAALAAAGSPLPVGDQPGDYQSTTNGISQSGFSGGNLNLKNEVADSWSFGGVYQPTLAPRFRLSVDWNNIAMKNAIELLSINDEMASCYDSASYPNLPVCQAFTRLTAATLSSDPKLRVVGDIAPGFEQSYFNTASLNFEGLIAAAQYSFDMPSELGTVGLGAQYTYTSRFDQVNFVGDPVIHEAGTVAAPRSRGAFTVNWAYRRFETSWNFQWTSKSTIENDCTSAVLPECDVPDYWLVNSSFSYKILDNLKAQLTIDNLFNKEIPTLALDERLFSTYDALGRRYMFRLTASF